MPVKKDKTDSNKAKMLVALEQSLGVVTTACKKLNLSRAQHYTWMGRDPEYKVKAEAMSEVALDFAETCLYNQMKDGVPSSTIFYLKTKGKQRGYIEDVLFNQATQIVIQMPDGTTIQNTPQVT